MKIAPNDIVLRPRFQLLLDQSSETILEAFEKQGSDQLTIKRLDEHIFIRFRKQYAHFWSPQLHLEILDQENSTCKVFGVFGPNSSLWTFFMFLHFGIATLFVILGIWAYSNAILDKPYALQAGGMIFLVLVWIVLYVLGRLGKRKGKPQMHELYHFMLKTTSTNQ